MAAHTPENGNNKNTVMEDALARAGVNKESTVNQQNNQQGGQQSGQPAGGGRRPKRESLVSAGVRSGNRFGRDDVSENISRYYETMKEILKRQVGEDLEDYRLVLFDAGKNMTSLSAIVLCLEEVVGGVSNVAIHALLIETSSSRLSNRQINLNGHQVEIQTVPGDVYDAAMYRMVEQTVSEAYGRKIVIHDANATVIPSELASDNETNLRSVLFNANAALYGVLDNALGDLEDRFTLTTIDTTAGSALARVDFEPGQATTAAGLPIRTDIAVTLQGQLNATTQGQMDQVRDLARIEGYIDLVFDPNANQAQFTPFGQPQQASQLYYPRFVITVADTCVDSVDMERILLGLGSASLLNQNATWVGAFRQRYVEGKMDLRDIGAVGYEANLTGATNQSEFARIDTKTNFGPQQLQSLMQTVMHPNLIYSMDIDEMSDLSWLHLTFIAAANGVEDARLAILESANTLTGGHFSKYFDPNAPIANDDVNRIHTGYYIDPNTNEKHDIRTIDYLAMLNLRGDSDMAAVVEFAETFDRTDQPLEYRLDRRLKLMKATFQDTIKVKGFARRITFNPQFINAINAGCHDAGLVIRPSNTIQEFGASGQRGNPNIGNFALQNNQSGLFSYAQQSYGPANNGQAAMGRWGRG